MLRHASVLVSFKLSNEMEASCATLRECFFARLVVTTRLLLGHHGGNGFFRYEGNAWRRLDCGPHSGFEMQNARLEGQALGFKNEWLLSCTEGIVIRY